MNGNKQNELEGDPDCWRCGGDGCHWCFDTNPVPAGAQEPVAFVNDKCAIQATLHGAITLKPGDNLYTAAPAVAVNERVGVIERYGYQALFNAIAEATKVEGGAIGVSVLDFAKSLEAAIAAAEAAKKGGT